MASHRPPFATDQTPAKPHGTSGCAGHRAGRSGATYTPMAFLEQNLRISIRTELFDKIDEGVLWQDKAFFEGIAALRLKKITKYWPERPKWILSNNYVQVLKTKK